MSKALLTLLLFLFVPTVTHASFLTDNWLSREYQAFREYPRMDKAYKLIKAQQYEKAVPLLQKVVKINPQHKQAQIALMEACLILKNYECVISAAENWKKKVPVEQLAAYYLSFAYHHQKESTKAIDNALAIVTADVSLETEHFAVLLDILVSELVNQGRAAEAVSWLIKYRDKNHLIRLSRILDWSHQLANHGFYKEGNQLLVQLPQEPRVVRARIVFLEKWGKPGEAAALMEAKLDTSLRKYSRYWLSLAELYQKSGDISGELRSLHSGIRQVEENKPLYHALLNRLIGLERLRKAAELAELMLQEQEDPILRLQLINLLAATQEYDAAIEQVKIILNENNLINKDVLELHKQLAYFLDKSNRQDELAQLLAQDYEATGNYQYLLQAEDKYRLLGEDVKRLQLLEDIFPFKAMPPSHRDYLVLELIKLYLANDETDKVLIVAVFSQGYVMLFYLHSIR